MADQMNINQKKQIEEARRLASQNDRIVADRQVIDSLFHDESDLARYELDMVRQENRTIDSLFEHMSVVTELSAKDKANLRNIQNRNGSFLLLNAEKFGGDSSLMSEIKRRVLGLEDTFRTMSGDPEGYKVVEEQFEGAISACKTYLAKRNPKFSKGKERKRMVEQQLDKLRDDLRFFQAGREKLKETQEQPSRIMDIMILGREENFKAEEPISGALDEEIKNYEFQANQIRNVAIFRMQKESDARDLLTNIFAGTEQIDKRIDAIKRETARLAGTDHMEGDNTENLSEKEKIEIRFRIGQLKKELASLLPIASERLNKLKTNSSYKKAVAGNDDPQMAQMEQQAFDHAVAEIMEQDNLSLEDAKTKFIEERMIAKRPYTLTHLKETRQLQMKDINEQQLGNKVRIDRNGNAHTGASDIRKRVKVWWDAARIKENMNKGMSREEAGENIPDYPITYEEAEKKALDYLEQVLKQNKSYQIRVPNCDIMKKIVENKRFKTQIETKQSYGGLNVVNQRKKFTAKKFGSKENLLDEKQYEVYGYLSHGDIKKEETFNPNNIRENVVGRGVEQYGQIIVKLKNNNMRYRTTMLVGDSYSNQKSGLPIMMEDKKDIASIGGMSGMCGFSTMVSEMMEHAWKEKNGEPVPPPNLDDLLNMTGQSYLELQFHGGVSVDDIDSITFIGDYKAAEGKPAADTEFDPELLKMCKENGIKAFSLKGGDMNEL